MSSFNDVTVIFPALVIVPGLSGNLQLSIKPIFIFVKLLLIGHPASSDAIANANSAFVYFLPFTVASSISFTTMA